ncbi:Dihydroorotase [uncultured delta proteobacterium]|uniref:Dihydroorotase n=1 Tax=uncultured delta proteobacterium TaxID=34034 RepID=A0A212KET1_9DELT|nr:Dihydroorotase [uncultured delta proteobacterium]
MSDNTSFLLTNAAYLGAATDVLVTGGRIASVGKAGSVTASPGTATIDAGGTILFPGFIDAHTHMRDPGYEWKENIASGLAAAANGGFSAIMCMANTMPVNDNASITRLILEKAAKAHPNGPRLYPIGALTVGLEGNELAPMAELAEAGCVAFSNDGRPITNTEIFRRGMEYASMWNRVVIDHCEDPFMAKGSHMNEGYTSGLIGVKGQPSIAEALHVARDILLAEYLDLPVHLAHISCRQSVELIIWAKNKGLKVTAETCPHYLHFTDDLLMGYNTAAKVNPPLRTPDDVAYLRKALADGVFDMLVTDHAPHAPHEKEEPLDEAPQGIMGLETALPLTYALVRDNVISEKQLVSLWSAGPARVFNLPANGMKTGDAADFALYDPDAEWVVGETTVKTKGRNTPLWGKTMRGKVTANWIGGVKVV